MKKRSAFLILAIVLAVFTVIAFVVPFDRTPVFWASYLFGLLAICIQAPLWRRALGSETLRGKFLGIPLVYIGISHLIVQLVVSTTMMAVPGIPLWIAIVVDVILLAVACALIVSGGIARSAMEETEGRVRAKTSFIKGLSADVAALHSREADAESREALGKLLEDVRYSDPMSDRALEDIEAEISEKLGAVSLAKENKLNLISEIRGLVQQRNIKCRSLK